MVFLRGTEAYLSIGEESSSKNLVVNVFQNETSDKRK